MIIHKTMKNILGLRSLLAKGIVHGAIAWYRVGIGIVFVFFINDILICER